MAENCPVCHIRMYIHTYVMYAYVRAGGTTRAGGAMALLLFLPNLNAQSIKALSDWHHEW